jgi:uncharacterized protein
MMKKIFIINIVFILLSVPYFSAGIMTEGNTTVYYRSISVFAPAVAKTSKGYRGVASIVTVTIQNGSECSGRVFVETVPLTQIDMQGSARLAVMVACTVTGIDISDYDFFFVVRTSAPVIGGPSAGAVMTISTISALENWTIDNKTMITGMINPDGSIGPVGGIVAKLDAAHDVGATRFLIPKGQNVYTELETVQTVQQEGNTQIVKIEQHPVTRKVSDYAMQKYGIEVTEVTDINDALLYMTGHMFNVSTSDHQITTENYFDTMKPLADGLLLEANISYQNASRIFGNSNIPNSYPLYYKNQIEKILVRGKESLDNAEYTYQNKHYYSSTSKSFQALINSEFVTYACHYFNSDDKDDYITSLLNVASSRVENESKGAKNADIIDLTSVQCVGAAQKRALDAEAQLESAIQSYQKGDALNTLYGIAFALERSKSIGWWLSISSKFEDYGKVNDTLLQNVAEKYLDSAEQARIYSSIVILETGKTSSLLSDAENLINEAKNEIDNYPASALFKSLEGLAKANLAIELIEGISNEKIERTMEKANTAIGESRNFGIEPILAVSYYEYAQSLENESPNDAIVYYKYAGLIAGALRFIMEPLERKTSRFVGVPETHIPIFPRLSTANIQMCYYMIIAGTICVTLAMLIGFIGVAARKQKNIFSSGDWIPRSVKEYYKKY